MHEASAAAEWESLYALAATSVKPDPYSSPAMRIWMGWRSLQKAARYDAFLCHHKGHIYYMPSRA